MSDALTALDAVNERLDTIDKRGRVIEWAGLQVNKDIARWIVAANRELQARETLIRELIRRLPTIDTWRERWKGEQAKRLEAESRLSKVLGWRENDWPEWFCRRTAEAVADLARDVEELGHCEACGDLRYMDFDAKMLCQQCNHDGALPIDTASDNT